MEEIHGSERIKNIKNKYCEMVPTISIERAVLYTEFWKKSEHENLPLSIRISMAMKHVYENMTYYIDDDDRIAGSWCEHFLGIPIDIERGVFNKVLETELGIFPMLRFRISSTFDSIKYLVLNRHLKEFLNNQKILRAAGPLPVAMHFKTIEVVMKCI